MRTSWNHTLTTLLVAVAVVLTAAGCGGDGDEPDTSSAASPVTDTGEDAAAEHDGGSSTLGEPGDPAAADRTIEIDATDALAFEPATVEVAVGETVTFVVTNTGQSPHDFTLGDEHAQEEHEAEMQEMMAEGSTMMHDEPNAVSIDPGATAEVTWHFTEAGQILYGCHQPAHYDAGMVGTITVTG